jgi:CoA-transferase family III
MTALSTDVIRQASAALGLRELPPNAIETHGTGGLPSVFAATDLAVGAIGTALAAIAQLRTQQFGLPSGVTIDRRLASLWFQRTIEPVGWQLPPAWDSIAGDYATRDGWIRLHTNAPHHKAAALRALECADDKEAVAARVAQWTADELESAVVNENGCAAAMRTLDEWRDHPQGRAVASEPLALMSTLPLTGVSLESSWRPVADRPLQGLKVLDLTRILAGPVATRFLAGHGADVLRIDPIDWEEASLSPEVTLGKRCARLDLKSAAGRANFERLLSRADVLVHGYRRGALDGLGYGEAARRALNPALIDVTLDAYGWSGPWSERRGFDSLVQMSSGIAHAGMVQKKSARPFPLPAQALDHATGYLMAAAVIRGLIARAFEGQAMAARFSLARTAQLLIGMPGGEAVESAGALADSDLSTALETTTWGPARRCKPPGQVEGAPMKWERGASSLGTAAAEF